MPEPGGIVDLEYPLQLRQKAVLLWFGQRVEEPLLGPQGDRLQLPLQPSAGRGEPHAVTAPVGGIPLAPCEPALFKLIDPGHEVALVEVERIGHLLLG